MREHRTAAFRVVNPDTMHEPSSLGYSQVAIVEPGARTVYVAGQAGGPDKGDFADQVRTAFDGVDAAMREAGGSVRDVVRLTVYIVDHDETKHRMLIEEVERVFEKRLAPTCTIVPLSQLGTEENMLVEIEAIGALIP